MYTEKTFTIPELKGISQQNIEEHLKLYSGYVANTNNILAEVAKLSADSVTDHAYAITEMTRRFSFEYNGMKNHEYYFSSFEGGPTSLTKESDLYQKIEADFGSFGTWFERFKGIAKTRGVGWVILYYDRDADQLLNTWVDEQHLGHLNSAQYIVGIDMWEHAFVADYQPSGKGQYIDDYFANLNWSKAEENFAKFN